jgi:hypothetical protein
MTKAVCFDRRLGVEDRHVGTRDRLDAAVVETRHPGYDGAVVKPKHELGRHLHPPAQPLHDSDEMTRAALAQRHEIDESDAAVRRLERRLQDQRIAAIATADHRIGIARGDAPMSVVRTTEQGCEDRTGIETRPAQPIDRAGTAHQRRGLAVADQSVIFDELRHDPMRRRRGTTAQGQWRCAIEVPPLAAVR